ncbi:MAG: hypothetical protein BGO39_03410 [Chloroflexi bacterium 54-19]|nr:MAG: hypothetical protein BGO39_03410 [Chloroflexi bacterium 54-19]
MLLGKFVFQCILKKDVLCMGVKNNIKSYWYKISHNSFSRFSFVPVIPLIAVVKSPTRSNDAEMRNTLRCPQAEHEYAVAGFDTFCGPGTPIKGASAKFLDFLDVLFNLIPRIVFVRVPG